jgi:hypothetical protein
MPTKAPVSGLKGNPNARKPTRIKDREDETQHVVNEHARKECPFGGLLPRHERPEGAHHVDALHAEEPRQRDQSGENGRAQQAAKIGPIQRCDISAPFRASAAILRADAQVMARGVAFLKERRRR